MLDNLAGARQIFRYAPGGPVKLILFALLMAAPPPGYYDAANGLTGEALRRALRDRIDHQTVIPYSGPRGSVTQALMETDAVPGGVRLLYSRATHPSASREWNKEHVWPQSHGVKTGPGHSDLHHIFACDQTVNNRRGDLRFDASGSRPGHAEAPDARVDEDSWEPPDYHKGDVARALMYMDVRYGFRLAEMGDPALMLAWHQLDPVDEFERRRNDLIDSRWQHNRNPFVDRPELAGAIWGSPAPAPAPRPVETVTEGEFSVAGRKNRVYHISKECEGARTLADPVYGPAARAGRRPHQGCPQQRAPGRSAVP